MEQNIENYIKENPMEGFDICHQCGVVQELNTMNDISELDFDIYCDECFQIFTINGDQNG